MAPLPEDRTRMMGIDTPETGQAFGKNAKDALAAFAGKVRVEGDEKDRNGRLIANRFTPGSTGPSTYSLSAMAGHGTTLTTATTWSWRQQSERPEKQNVACGRSLTAHRTTHLF